MLATKREPTLERPYPGLRSFEPDEATLFNGRDRQTGELLRRLSHDRFLAVVGGSGSGKSSLVRAGLLPALYRGYLVGASSRWRVAVMRPGSSPLAELTKALASPRALGASDESVICESSFGLLNTVRAADLEPGESLLLVVDQFEELFRFRRESANRDGGAEASLFVSQLLQAADAFGAAIYIVITMRSDFLGDCAQFPGLPEALNKGQYLIPRMTREQRREAITDALDLFDASMTDRLVQRLLNDTGDDPDQLPVLQHALQQTYAVWEREGRAGEIDLDHYTRAGTMENALHDHAESVYQSAGESQWIVEKIFRCLTVDENNRAVRRPAKLERILRVIGVAGDPLYEPEAIRIIKLFGAPEHSFLVWDRRPDLDPGSVVDISHESLIRKWRTLQEWVREESKAVDIYRYVRRDAALYPNDAALWGDPDLSGALRTRDATGWNEAWAGQYSQGAGASFEQVQQFLQQSVEERDRLRRKEQWFTRLKWGAAVLVAILLGGALWGWRIYRQNETLKAAEKNLSASNAALQSGLDGLTKRSQELQKEIQEKERQAATNPNATAEIALLKDDFKRTQQVLNERNKVIQASKEPPAQDSAALVARIAQLQTSLDQAWKENTRLAQVNKDLNDPRGALDKSPAKGGSSPAEVADLRSRLEESEAERVRLQQQLRAATVSPSDQLGPFIPVVAVQKTFRTYGNGASRFGVLLGDLPSDRSASARVYVLNGRALDEFEKRHASDLKAAELKRVLEYFERDTPCAGRPDPGGAHCFLVQKQKTNAETQVLGTVHLGSTGYVLHAMAWTQNAVGGAGTLTLAFSPSGRVAAPNSAAQNSALPIRASSESSQRSTSVTLTLAGRYLQGSVKLDEALGEQWKGRSIQFPEQWNATPGVVIVDVLHSTQTGARFKRLSGSKLEPDSVIACTIPQGQTCWVTDTSGQKLGIAARSVGAGAPKAELTLQVPQ